MFRVDENSVICKLRNTHTHTQVPSVPVVTLLRSPKFETKNSVHTQPLMFQVCQCSAEGGIDLLVQGGRK